MATSNTYTFGTVTEVDDLIRHAYNNIGVVGEEFTGVQIQNAIMAANLELTSLQGDVPLQFLRRRFMLELKLGQGGYALPNSITRVVDVVAIQPLRQNTFGVASSSAVAAGNPSNCFINGNLTGCTLSTPDGNISFTYTVGNEQAIQYVGITPLVDGSAYTLDIQYTFDGANWITAVNTPLTTYHVKNIQWWVVEIPVKAIGWRIKETQGAILEIQQIYFSTPTTMGSGDRYLTEISYTEWMQIATKTSTGFPSCYFFNAQKQPYIMIWPLQDASSPAPYTALLYDGYQASQDVVYLFQQVDLPQRFFDSFVAGVSLRLAQIKSTELNIPIEKLRYLESIADKATKSANRTDQTDVTIRMQPNINYYPARR